MNARMRRIASDYEQIMKDFSNHKYIVVEPIGGEPAEKYRVTYNINGIYLLEDGRVQTLGKHVVIITLHAEYPRYKPICNILTPIWHPNFRDGQICIGDIWGAGESLSDIIINIGNMIQYKSWNSFSPLSAEAAEWAIANKNLFPVGNVDLWTGQEIDSSSAGSFDIDLNSDDEKTIPAFEENVGAKMSGANYPSQTSQQGYNQDIEFTENDFEITPEELVGIEFVPTVERMQSSRYGATAKSGKINFKTVLLKGILWALIGAFVGFGFTELFEGIMDNSVAAKILGESNLSQYYKYQNEADEVLDDIYDDFRDYCDDNNLDEDSEEIFNEWMRQTYSKYEKQYDRYGDLSEKANEALYAAYEYDFNSNEDEMLNTMKNVTRVHTAIWSAFIALFIGLFLGLGEGVYYGSASNAVKYSLIGAGIALSIGAASGYIAQWMYESLLSDSSSDFIKALVRGLGWAIMGSGVGAGIGLIKPNGKRILFCILGGTAGAFIGGFLFNYVVEIIPEDVVARGIAIVFMGLLIGILVGLLEQVAKAAWLKVIRGEFEGKEYLVFTGVTSIGNSGKNVIVLFKDKLIAPNHCDIVQEGNKYVLVDKGSPMGTLVNGMRINRHVLRKGDAIAIGNSVLVFNTK